jgi:hypothetical protein
LDQSDEPAVGTYRAATQLRNHDQVIPVRCVGGFLILTVLLHTALQLFTLNGPLGRVERSCAVFRSALCSPFAPAFRFRECQSIRPCPTQSLSLTEACLRNYRTSLFIQSFTPRSRSQVEPHDFWKGGITIWKAVKDEQARIITETKAELDKRRWKIRHY